MSIYGNPVTLGPRWMTAKKVSILPFQNLHGYDHPWPDGGGKNLLRNYAASGTYSQIVYTVNSDGTVITNGTSSASDGLNILANFTLPVGSYVLSGCPSGGGNYKYALVIVINGVTQYDYGSGLSFTISNGDTINRVRIVIYYGSSGIKVDNLVWKPMICLSTATNPDYAHFEPYSNICPIYGWEDCRIWVSPTPNPADGTTYQTLFGNPPGTVYGGEYDLTTGVLSVMWGYIASYAGETLPGRWISDRDTYAPNTTPTTGAEVCYELATPVTYQLTPQQISFLGNQYFGANCGPVLIKVGK